jgi:cytochrome c553
VYRSIALFLALGLCCAGAIAQVRTFGETSPELKAALAVKGDAARGQAAFAPCVGCHRQDASGRVSGAYPRLSGQHATVIMKQIVDISAGRRSNPKMEPFLGDHGMTPYEVADLATFLESLPISDANGKGVVTNTARGRQLYEKDCAVCHGRKGEGDASQFYPMVAAQHYRYLLREVSFIRDGDRRNADADMVNLLKPYAATDLEAVAGYMAQLPPPR